MEYRKINYLSKSSYPAIIEEIINKIQEAQDLTLTGSDFLGKIYKSLNESITPMLDLKEFVTGAEKIANDDVKFKEILDFIVKKTNDNTDLNFLINLAKEEHFAEMQRMYHPAPKDTVKKIENMFTEHNSVIEQGIRSGLFDGLQSKLLNKIKIDLKVEKPLNESEVLYNDTLVKYSPIGLTYDDSVNNKVILLLENCSFEIDENKEIKPLNENIDIPAKIKQLMGAINTCSYNPKENTFSLNESWDFELELNSEGKVFVTNANKVRKEIPNEKVRAMLFESINYYDNFKTLNNFNKEAFLKDGDRFLTLMENCDLLVKFDNLKIIKNLNENSMIIFQEDSLMNLNTPELLYSSNGKTKFNSYSELNESCSQMLNYNLTNLFESHLKNEQFIANVNQTNYTNLMEEQKELNEGLTKIGKLKTIAEENSPTMKNLMEQELTLRTLLDSNIEKLKFFV